MFFLVDVHFYSLFSFLFKCNNFLQVGMKKRRRNHFIAKIIFLIRKKLTRIFDISHWIYSFGVVSKVYSLCTIYKSFMFLLYVFSFKCFNVFFWIDGKSHKTWVTDMFNFITSEYFFLFWISCLELPPEFAQCIKSI